MLRINKIFIGVMILSGIFAVLQGGNLPYSIFYSISIIFFIGLFFTEKKQRDIYVKIKFTKDIYSAGESDYFTTIVRNIGIVPVPYIFVLNKTYKRFNSQYFGDFISLGFDGNKGIKNLISFTSRGIYNFGNFDLSINDLFGIFERKRIIRRPYVVKVYPKIYNLSNFDIYGGDLFENVKSALNINEDQTVVRDVRKYKTGDNLRKIHWKVSAKYGELYIKNFDNVSGEKSNMFINMNRENLYALDSDVIEEKLIDFSVSMVNFMEQSGVNSRVFINSSNSKTLEINSREDFNELLENFLTEKSDGEREFSEFINYHVRTIGRVEAVSILSIRTDDKTKEKLIALNDEGYIITLFYYSEKNELLPNIDVLKKAGIKCFNYNEILSKANRVGK